MRKIRIILLFLVFILLAQVANAQNRPFFYYLIPQGATLTINDKTVSNDGFMGKMLYQDSSDEKIVVDKNTSGIRIRTASYAVDIKPNVELTITDSITLEAGSIHIITEANRTEQNTLFIGELQISFQSADFVAYISGDKKDKVIKVFQGEVAVSQPKTDQNTIIKKLQIISTDAEGRLLSPYSFETKTEIKNWWDDTQYQYEVKKLPLADAGADQRVLGNIQVVLDGSASGYQTGDIFEWTLEQGPKDDTGTAITEVEFDSSNIVKPLFTPLIEGKYTFSLQITDQKGEQSNLDQTTVFVGKRYLRPIAIFPDVPAEHPNNLAITYLYKKNVMKGSEDPDSGKTLFRPDDTINRVEILKTVFENKKKEIPTVEELQSTDSEIFIDVKADQWFAPYVFLAKKEGIIKGNDGLYRPADKVLLVEAIKIIIQANQISLEEFQNSTQLPYPDVQPDAWYLPYLSFIKKYNLFDADSKGNINPAQELTRAKFAEMLYRMESVNLLEKRGYLNGTLKSESSDKPVPNADIYIYKTIEIPSDTSKSAPELAKKGKLFLKTLTQQDGKFTVSLPIQTKYYIEAVKDNAVSSNKIITELTEEKSTTIDLKIKISSESTNATQDAATAPDESLQ